MTNEPTAAQASAGAVSESLQAAIAFKQRAYRVGLVMALAAAAYPVVASLRGMDDFSPVHTLVNFPIMAVCVWLIVLTRRQSSLPHVEAVMAICAGGYVLMWDIINFALRRPPEVAIGATEALVVIVGLLTSVVLPPRRAVSVIAAFFFFHQALCWANLLRFEWSILLSNHVINDILSAVAVALATLVSVYNRLLGAAEHDRLSQAILARTDALTGLLNRRGLAERLGGCEAITLVVFDIDDFKRINDRFGHNVGDEVLVDVADALMQAAGGIGYVSRWGGEEFLVALPGGTLDSGQRVYKSTTEWLKRNCRVSTVTISAGLGSAETGRQWQEALHSADAALYAAKRSGKAQLRATEVSSVA